VKKLQVPAICAGLLILLFVYNSLDKLGGLWRFREEINNQPLPNAWTPYLIYGIPVIELLISGALLWRPAERIGFCAAAVLLTIFTGYIAAVLLHAFDYTPCSCAGVIKGMSWRLHFFFNLFFITVALTGLVSRRRAKLTAAP
jgi:putative oxidoreductase